ncbi:MAG: lysine--tRNA ligase [Candidatus Heimdallarchaeota archaeon]|nr:lysine--tRNA ligase [Candidatus Heimdallarchaeota archaeon]
MEEKFHWAIRVAEEAIEIFGDEHVVCSGWSPSGVYHYGNSKEAITCNAFHRELLEMDKSSKFIFVVDDMDPLNKIPHELKQYTTELKKFIGHPISRVPDFTKSTESYARYFANAAEEAFDRFGFDVEIVYASDLYKQGKYDDALNIFMDKEDELQKLIESISGSPLKSLINVICANCGSISAPVIDKIDRNEVHYTCTSYKQFRGCDHQAVTKIKDHEWKLRWRLDWPARQRFLNVTIEPSGKDHSVQGGSVDTALAIHEKIFERTPPILERFGFITIKGQKISGSKGGALEARKISDIMPFSAYLFLNYRADLLKDINFNPGTVEFANLIDDFDRARKALLGLEVSGTEQEIRKLKIAADLAMTEEERRVTPSMFKYAELILLYQVSLRDVDRTIEKLSDKIEGELGEQEIRQRLKTIDRWLDTYAPDNMKYEFLLENAEGLEKHWNTTIREIWLETLAHFTDDFDDQEFTSYLRDKATEKGSNAQEIYPPFYQMILGTARGPNAAGLIKALGRMDLKDRIEQINC